MQTYARAHTQIQKITLSGILSLNSAGFGRNQNHLLLFRYVTHEIRHPI